MKRSGSWLLVLWVLWSCGGGESVSVDSASPSAHPEIVEALRADAEATRHSSDGGGRVWLEGGSGNPELAATVSGSGTWAFVFETGPEGIAEGGWIYFQAPPFWGWSAPHTLERRYPGFTEVSTEAGGVQLEPLSFENGLLGLRVAGRGLEPGELVRVVYGAGESGATADRFAESRSEFFFAVDGDGDGVRALLTATPWIDVEPGPAAQLVLTLSSSARPGDTIRLNVAVLDAVGNAGVAAVGDLRLDVSGGSLELPETITLDADDRGARSLEARVDEVGIYRVAAEGLGTLGGLEGISNPLVAAEAGRRILWGDLHGHSGLSDGTGTPADYFRYARDVAGLDVSALTDHDHWGMRPLATHPELWEEIRQQAAIHHEPGRFVTLLGFEWTNWLHGHRHVLYFGDEDRVLSSVDPRYETPDLLWTALRGKDALTFAHHSAGGPIATNWDYPPDPDLEPVTEIVSVHGSSEAPDSPRPIYSPVAGNFVRDALEKGFVLGFIGSGDGHDGHPGLSHLAGASGGLAAILSNDLTREGVLEALRARRVYATNGPRIYLRTTLGGREMGSAVVLESESGRRAGTGSEPLAVLAVASAPLDGLDLIRSGRPVERIPCQGSEICQFSRDLTGLTAGEWVYVRAVQDDGGAAWSSPFFIRDR
jgi:hypothetical protein